MKISKNGSKKSGYVLAQMVRSRGDCARGSKSEGKPKCLPQKKAQSLGKKGRKTAANQKTQTRSR